MRLRTPLVVACACWAPCLGACGGSGARAPGAAASAGPTAHVEVVRANDRPAFTLVERQGDPAAGVAVAIATNGGSPVSVAIAALLASRLRAAGFIDVRSSVDALGFEVSASAATPDKARTFVATTAEALSRAVEAGDPAIAAIEHDLAALTRTAPLGRAARATADCSGELVPVRKEDLPDLRSPAGLATLHAWTERAHSARAVSYAAVGARASIEAVSNAVGSIHGWPEGDDDALDTAWPSSDAAGATPSYGPSRHVAVALRVGESALAAAAAAALSDGDALLDRASLISPGSSVERVWYTARPRGACLRADVVLAEPTAVPAGRLAALVLAIRDEMDRALDAARGAQWSFEQTIVGAADPRSAAAIAAWLGLRDRLPTGAPRQAAVARLPALESEAADGALAAALDAQRAARSHTIDRTVRVEHGQGELWALLASPCGTRGEGSDDAGLTALALRALATRSTRGDGVRVEPWLTPDGAGLLAHAPPRDANEGDSALAQRLGRALARAVTGRPSSSETAAARSGLLEELAQRGGAGWWTTLDALAPGHPSWLQASGTWTGVSEVTAAGVRTREAVLLDRPLRLAVLANGSDAQAAEIQRELEQWLSPVRPVVRPCAERPGAMPRSGAFSVETSDVPSLPAAPAAARSTSAFVAVPVPPVESGLPAEAEVATALLNGRNGWLDRALVAPGLATSAHAVALGGRRAAALVIEVQALEGKLDRAVSQLRALLARLAQGGLSDDDARSALQSWMREHDAKSMDPRYRIVRLWSGTAPPAPTAASLQRFLRALGPASHIVVTVKTRP